MFDFNLSLSYVCLFIVALYGLALTSAGKTSFFATINAHISIFTAWVVSFITATAKLA